MATVKTTKLVITVKKTSDWETGYDGAFVLENKNTYDVLEWGLSFDFPASEGFTWFSEGDLVRQNDHVTMTPKDWNMVIPAGTTKVLGFGGTKTLPTNLKYEQILPLVGDDPSLAKRGAWGSKNVAPYVDACAFPTPNLQDITKGSGLKYFTLAFITADSKNRASWAGVIPLETQHMLDQVRKVRYAGGDVSVSFGGANGIELAEAITDLDVLVAEYSRVIDMYSLVRLDFDIEGGAIAHSDSVDRRNKAIVMLKEKYPHLQITYCLPVLPIGLTLAGELLVRNARQNNAVIESFNGMSMDFGDSAAPDPEGRMGSYVIMSSENLRSQVLAAGYQNPKIGTIPMIGVNDVTSEVFRISDAKKVYEFFQKMSWMTYVGFWSTNRDRPGPGNGANPFDSGIKQNPYDFTKTFLGERVDELDPSPRPNPPAIKLPEGNPTPLPPFVPAHQKPPTPVADVKVDGVVTAVVSVDKVKISYKKPNATRATVPTVTKKKHNVKIDDKIIVTLKGVDFAYVSFEKAVIDTPSKVVHRPNVNVLWPVVSVEFVKRCGSGEDPDDVIKDLQTRYAGLGPNNQDSLKKMLS